MYAVHHDIREDDVFDHRLLDARIVPWSGILIEHPHADASAGIHHRDIGEGAISHHAIAAPGEPNAVGIATKSAVRDGHAFAWANLPVPIGPIVGPYDERVIAHLDSAVRDRHVSAAIEMEAVIVRMIDVGDHFRPIKDHAVAVVDHVRPAGRLIGNCDIGDRDIATACKEDKARRRQFPSANAFVAPLAPLLLWEQTDERIRIAVYHAVACE